MTRHVLGVDAGGTKTIALVADETGRVLGAGTAGPGNPDGVGGPVARHSLAQAISAAVDAANGIDLDAAFAGVAGVVTDADRDAARSMLVAAGVRADVLDVDHDCRIALAGALSGRPGVVLIAGTGASAYGRTARGHDWLASGWGSLLGDEGSSYWLSTQALRAVVRAEDGRGQTTMLSGLLLAELGVDDPRALPGRVTRGEFPRPRLAALAPLVVAAAERGDEVAARLVDQTAAELAGSVAAVVHAVDFGNRVEVALVGGLFGAEVARFGVAAQIADRIPEASVIPPEAAPVTGALLLALARVRRVAPEQVPADIVRRLRDTPAVGQPRVRAPSPSPWPPVPADTAAADLMDRPSAHS